MANAKTGRITPKQTPVVQKHATRKAMDGEQICTGKTEVILLDMYLVKLQSDEKGCIL